MIKQRVYGIVHEKLGVIVGRYLIALNPEKAYYTQAVSIQAFSEFNCGRLLRVKHVDGESPYNKLDNHCHVFCNLLVLHNRQQFDAYETDVPVVEFDNLWDCYRAIGYEWRLRKYVPVDPVLIETSA